MEENKKEKKILKQVIIIIAILSTYVMVFLLGRITNILTLGVKDEEKPEDTVITKPTSKPTTKPIYIPGQTPEVEPSTEPGETPKPSATPSTGTPTPVPTSKPEIVDGIITLWEGNKKWEQLAELNVFKGYFYEKDYTNKIAPGFSGTYEFDLENNWNKPVTYILNFEEENPHNVNMVYKVIREGKYVLGNDTQSVYIDGVKLEAITIPANTKRRYQLKWKWEDTSYDTQIGQKDSAEYKLKIKLQATVEG